MQRGQHFYYEDIKDNVAIQKNSIFLNHIANLKKLFCAKAITTFLQLRNATFQSSFISRENFAEYAIK